MFLMTHSNRFDLSFDSPPSGTPELGALYDLRIEGSLSLLRLTRFVSMRCSKSHLL